MSEAEQIDPVEPTDPVEPSGSDEAPAPVDWKSKVDWDAKAEEAAKYGWSPEGVEGKPFVDPVTFLERYNTVNVSKTAQERLEREVRKIQEQNAKLLTEQSKVQRERLEREWTEKHRKAVEDGDVLAAQKAAEEMANARKAPEPVDDLSESNNRVIAEWQAKNAWFQTDQNRQDVAQAIYGREVQRLGRDDAAAILPLVDAEMAKRFPSGEPPKPPRAAPVEGVPGKRLKTNKWTAKDIPAEYADIANGMVKAGAFKNLDAYAQALGESGDLG